MDGTKQAQSRYYQTIARELFRLRGAPFYLSPNDVALIADWEKRRIPLDAVLDGMGRAFDNFKKGRRPAKALTLAVCEYQVMKAQVQHAERKAGSGVKAVSRDHKKARLIREASNFLETAPPGLETLRTIFGKALEILRSPETDEKALEKLDDDVDEALWQGVRAEEKEDVRRGISVEFAGRRGADHQIVLKTRLVKNQRDKHKIPYLSLYYY